MHSPLETGSYLKTDQIEENQIFAEIEEIVSKLPSKTEKSDDVTVARDGRSRQSALLLLAVLALIAVLVPAGLKNGEMLVGLARQAAGG